MKKWFALDIIVEAEATEAIESALNQLDCLGTEIDSFRQKNGGPPIVTGFFDVLPEDADVRTVVDETLRIYGFVSHAVKEISIRVVEEIDWLAEWKKYWQPTMAGKFIIAPLWAEVGETDKIVIRIEPNMAFGTGTHETTQLCLQAISDNYREGEAFLDVGTGTGILAIAVAKIQGKKQKSKIKISACDTDVDSVKIARENSVANGVGDIIEFMEGSIDDDTPGYDFVCANLTIDVIVPMLPLFLKKTEKLLVLSGILVEQKGIIETELKKFEISNFKLEIKGEWISVVIENK